MLGTEQGKGIDGQGRRRESEERRQGTDNGKVKTGKKCEEGRGEGGTLDEEEEREVWACTWIINDQVCVCV